MNTTGKWISFAAAIAALLGGGLFACEELDLLEREATTVTAFDDNKEQDPPPNGVAPAPEKVDYIAPFKEHVMFDRNRAPDWFGEVTHVRLENGTLYAETTLPPGWRDISRQSRPAESICGNLYSYTVRTAKLTWTTIVVKASDGSALVTRQGTGGSCKQT